MVGSIAQMLLLLRKPHFGKIDSLLPSMPSTDTSIRTKAALFQLETFNLYSKFPVKSRFGPIKEASTEVIMKAWHTAFL